MASVREKEDKIHSWTTLRTFKHIAFVRNEIDKVQAHERRHQNSKHVESVGKEED